MNNAQPFSDKERKSLESMIDAMRVIRRNIEFRIMLYGLYWFEGRDTGGHRPCDEMQVWPISRVGVLIPTQDIGPPEET